MSTDPNYDDPQNPHFHKSVDWELRQRNPIRRFLNFLERVSLGVEAPLSKIFGKPELNPLYHTGTITTFLLLVILLTGVYLTLFYQFGFDASYDSVSKIETNFVGRIMRSAHRYASAAVVFTALLHGWRTFFQDRFRGPRWLAWVSGIGMSGLVWLIGISGYWLIWDERAQLLNLSLFKFLENSKMGVSFLLKTLVSDSATTGWVFMVVVITVHLGLSALVGLFYWWHIKRLNRPKLMPPRFWMWVSGGLLTIFAVLIPVGMLPQASFELIPAEIPLDVFYLFYLPSALRVSPWSLWGGILLLFVSLSIVPWLLLRKPLVPIQVNPERCTGCTLCEADCPYKAITMIPQASESKRKLIAQVDPKMCVACGVRIGSCDPLALTLGQQPAEGLWDAAVVGYKEIDGDPQPVVFTCERHMMQNLSKIHNLRKAGMQVVPVTCVGMIHPRLIAQTWEAGAAEVHIIGCPPDDCANREGNLHLQRGLDGDRKPILRSKYVDAPIMTDWLPPNDFKTALNSKVHQVNATTYDFVVSRKLWKSFIPALILLAVVLGLQVLATALPYRPILAAKADVEIIMNHRAGYPIEDVESDLEPNPSPAIGTRLVLKVDKKILLDKIYAPRGGESRAQVFERFQINTGEHHISLIMFDRKGETQFQVLVDEMANLNAGQILRLQFEDAHIGSDPVAGEKLYFEASLGTNASCRICHSLDPYEELVGPTFFGIATRASERVQGLSAEEYLRQSILEPDVFVVDGFPSGLMVPNLDDSLTEAQINDLVAFLMTME